MAELNDPREGAPPKQERFPLRNERDLAIRTAVRFAGIELILLPFVFLVSPRAFLGFGFAASVALSSWSSSLYLLSDMGKLIHAQDLRNESYRVEKREP